MKAKLRLFGVIATFLWLAGGLVLPSRAAPPEQGPIGDAAPPIQLLTRTFVPEPGVDPTLRSLALAQADRRIHVLLQMDHIPTPEEREALAAQGIELQEYVPQQAWIALLPAGEIARLRARPEIRWIGPWDVRDKLSPRMQAGDFPEWAIHENGRVQVMVLLHGDVSLAEGEALVTKHNGIIAGSVSTPLALTAWVMPETLPALAAEEGVLWIEEGTPPLTPTNDDARRALGVDTLHAAPYNLDGSGVKVFVFDEGRVGSHLAFSGRLTYVDGAPVKDHSTHIAGTAAGDGTGSPPGRDLKGMAPAARIYSAGYEQTFGTAFFWDNAGDIQADYAAARHTYGVDLATNSIGSNTAKFFDCDLEGDYGVSSSLIDGIVRGDNAAVGSPYIALWSNGNERTGGTTDSGPGRCGSNYRTTAPPSCAKNPIHVGATNSDGDSMTSFSSWGPCDDGRLKPIVSGPGCETGRVSGEKYINSTLPGNKYGGICGTSMATPAVAGVASLAIQQFRDTIGNSTARPSNALMKVWLIHTARDLGNDGPDYVYGYGEVDAVAAIDLVKSSFNYTTDSISQNQMDAYTYPVPAGASQFKVSLAWDDYPAAPFAAKALVNDLDLEVQAPGGTIYNPFSLDPANPQNPATAIGPNTRDNQEQVIVPNPAPGTWTIRVRGKSVPASPPASPQSYALAYSHEVNVPSCSQAIVNGGFETDTGNWTLDGATRVSSPGVPPFGGSSSLQLGGNINTNHTAYQIVSIPADIDLVANLSFAWYMTTDEGDYGHGYDEFYVEVRDTSDNPLAVYKLRSDGWLQDTWLAGENIDLTSFAGQTVRIAFYATNDEFAPTTFYVDNVELALCKNNVPDLSILKQVMGGQVVHPGDPVTFTLMIANAGIATASGVVVTDILSADILSPSWDSSASLAGTTARGGAPFVWDLPDLAADASGVITVYGTLNPALSPDFTIPNTATISTNTPETNLSNNSSHVLAGLNVRYLPVIFKNGQ